MLQLKDKLIGVTGGTGFLGKHICELLRWHGADVIALSHHRRGGEQVNLLNTTSVWNTFGRHQFDYVIHAAGYNGGIAFNMAYPYGIFANNTEMAINVINACIAHRVNKLVSLVTSCGYPDVHCINENMTEDLYLHGVVNDTVACHGYAKRNLVLASKYAKQQEGLNAITVCPTTLYGPHDNFSEKKSKVMGGLIRRFMKAAQEKATEVTCWGTGAAMREFMYVRDAANYVILALQKYEDSERPLNIGSGQELTVKELAEKVAKAVKYYGAIRWDTSKPDGQARKRLSRKRQLEILGELPLTPLDAGIENTVNWCLKNQEVLI